MRTFHIDTPPQALDVDWPEARRFMTSVRAAGKKLTVRLDGVLQEKVLAYSQLEGWVRRYKIQDGRPVIENDHIVHEVVPGRVEIGIEDA